MKPVFSVTTRILPVLLCSLSINSSYGMADKPDFSQSDKFLNGKADKDLVNGDINYHWLDEGEALWYKYQDAEKVRFIKVDATSGSSKDLFNHNKMAQALSAALDKNIDPQQLPIDALVLHTNQQFIVTSDEQTFRCNLANITCLPQASSAPVLEVPSPDAVYSVSLKDYNLWLTDTSNNTSHALTTEGSEHNVYGGTPESGGQEITNRRKGINMPPNILWSPQSDKFVSYRQDERHIKPLSLVQFVPEDGTFRPKLHQYRDVLLGEKRGIAWFEIFDINSGKRIPIDYKGVPSSLASPIARGDVWWSSDGSKLYLLDADTTAQHIKLLEIDANSGKTRLMLEETNDTVLLTSSSYLAQPSIKVLDNGDIIWYSERSGWGHLYLYDGETGKLKHPVTQGAWLVKSILNIDQKAGWIYFTASGQQADQDIYYHQIYRARLDGSKIELLTPEAGNHQPSLPMPYFRKIITSMFGKVPESAFSPTGRYFVDFVSTPEQPGVWNLRRNDGKLVKRLATVETTRLPEFTMPETFQVKSEDGKYTLYGTLLKPSDFDPNKRYPVIDAIYPGPQIIKAPKSFASAIFGQAQALAELGFIVYMIDGRGTPWRSKEFMDLSYGHMETAGMLSDHIAGLRQLAKTRPWLDLDRVGMYGTSGGGYATARALIDYPDFFKVGVASAGDHEMRAYSITWGGTYHGPLDKMDYQRLSNANDVSKFKGKLLIAHGDMDDNVHPANTMFLVDALIKANKYFDMLIMPNVNHGIAGIPYFQRRLEMYFLENLKNAKLQRDADMVAITQ